jgi:hypothetical protein
MNPQLPDLSLIILLQLIFGVGTLIIGGFVTYMFYARLRDIADELRKIRVTYEMEQDRTIRSAAKSATATSGDNPFAKDARNRPKE